MVTVLGIITAGAVVGIWMFISSNASFDKHGCGRT